MLTNIFIKQKNYNTITKFLYNKRYTLQKYSKQFRNKVFRKKYTQTIVLTNIIKNYVLLIKRKHIFKLWRWNKWKRWNWFKKINKIKKNSANYANRIIVAFTHGLKYVKKSIFNRVNKKHFFRFWRRTNRLLFTSHRLILPFRYFNKLPDQNSKLTTQWTRLWYNLFYIKQIFINFKKQKLPRINYLKINDKIILKNKKRELSVKNIKIYGNFEWQKNWTKYLRKLTYITTKRPIPYYNIVNQQYVQGLNIFAIIQYFKQRNNKKQKCKQRAWKEKRQLKRLHFFFRNYGFRKNKAKLQRKLQKRKKFKKIFFI